MPSYAFKTNTGAINIIQRFQQLKVIIPDSECKLQEAIDIHVAKLTTDRTYNALGMAQTIKKLGRADWAYWDLVVLGQETDPKIRMVMLETMGDQITSGLSQALIWIIQLYLRMHWLTNEEDVYIEPFIQQYDPAQWQKFVDGTYKRAKNG